jgi:transcriptional regulator of acetoin/glycerol metabolism
VLQERELSPLGGGKPVKLDFALVCATHRNLDAAIAEGRFRADLYYRIAHHIATLPPLRDHPERTGLVRDLWQAIGDGRRLDAAALARLAGHDWPGNLRQLVVCLRTLVALSDPGQTLGLEQLPGWLRTAALRPAAVAAPLSGGVPPVEGRLDAVAVATMRQALADCGGNVSRAARVLGISRSTLYRRLGLGG